MSSSSSDEMSRGFLDKLQLVGTLVIAALGVFISWKQVVLQGNQVSIQDKQDEIAQQLETQKQQLEERRTITQQSAALLKETRDYLNSLALDETKKKRILLSLLKIETEIRVSRTGELSENKETRLAVDALPFHLALLVGDSEALAHIGGSQDDLRLWLPIAKASGDLQVRRTAINALRNVAVVKDDPKIIKLCVDTIIDLTRRWNVPELEAEGSVAIQAIAKSYQHAEPANGSEIGTLIGEALRELEGSASIAADASAATEPASAPPLSGPDIASKQSEAIAAVRQLRQTYEPTASVNRAGNSLNDLIRDLRSDDTKVRRLARSKISDFGLDAVPRLFEELKDHPNNYRIKIGVVTALSLMDPSLRFSDADLTLVVALLGDPDTTLRKNTAIFLGRLSNPATLNVVREELEVLSANSSNLINSNLIYNSVIVLGDWLAYNETIPDNLRPRIVESLKTIDKRLAADRRNGWKRTRQHIDSYLESHAR